MIATYDFISGVDLPGELDPDPLPDMLDLLPAIGGCGQALLTAAQIPTCRVDVAQDHLDDCAACRAALVAVGDAERSAYALASFSADTETPHAARLATTAA